MSQQNKIGVNPILWDWTILTGPDPFAKVPQKKAPKNNEGRKTCYWCGAPTKSVMLFTSITDVCTKCGE